VIATLLTVSGLVAVTFVATNLDNLVLLVGWMVADGIPARAIFSGYLLGMLGVLLIALLLGLVGYLIPVELLGYLGVIPIALGLKMLWELRQAATLVCEAIPAPQVSGVATAFAAVAVTQLSNGVDTVLVFAPLLADSREDIDLLIVISFVVVTLLWYAIARLLSGQVQRIRPLTRVGRWIAPVVMILVGIYILGNTGTDMVVQPGTG